MGLAWTLSTLGEAAFYRGDYQTARLHNEARLAIERELGNDRGVWHALWMLGVVARAEGNTALAIDLDERSLILARGCGDIWRLVVSLRDLALTALHQGDYSTAMAHSERGVLLSEELGDGWVRAWAFETLGWAAFGGGDNRHAGSAFAQSLRIALGADHEQAIVDSLTGLAALAVGSGEPARAVRLFAAAEALCGSAGPPRRSGVRALFEPCLEAARSALDSAAFAMEWSRGYNLDTAAACREALSIVSAHTVAT